jgi:hypothetical protein
MEKESVIVAVVAQITVGREFATGHTTVMVKNCVERVQRESG